MKYIKKVIVFLILILQCISPNVFAEKIAVISDIHGNYHALFAVLEDIKRQNVDKIICLGDIVAKGPDSDLTLELIQKKADITIMGNCDISSVYNGDPEYSEFTHYQLSEEQKDFLKNLPVSFDMKISGRNVRFFHASPTNLKIKINTNSDLESKLNMFKNTEFLNKTENDPVPDVIIYGHVHTQFMQKIAGRSLINVGSAGNSSDFDTLLNSQKSESEKIPYAPQEKRIEIVTQANYAIIEGKIGSDKIDDFSVSFKEINYNIEAAVQSALNKEENFPNIIYYINIITKGSVEG